MSSEIGIDELLVAHGGIDTIISSFYPDEPEGDADNVLNVISSVNQSSCATSHNFTQAMSNFLEDISALVKLNQELAAIDENINNATLNEKSSTLMHPEILGNLSTWCQEVEQHLQLTIENKDLLIYHLQQPLVSNFLTMHYQYHKDLISLVGELVDMLNNVPSHIQLVEDHAQNSILKRSVSCISTVTRTVTELRNTLGDITALQSLITEMLEAKD
ncbi:uncharacterized protein [Panulirus ornatus]|uniref:uncharacterized protein isoform X2 n=1 Tax=Panulirus ornatus TaxID=150431 RepID=UPI003A83CD86